MLGVCLLCVLLVECYVLLVRRLLCVDVCCVLLVVRRSLRVA